MAATTRRMARVSPAPPRGRASSDAVPRKASPGHPDTATQAALKVLAEEIEELRAELRKVQAEVATLRAAVAPQRRLTFPYRGVLDE